MKFNKYYFSFFIESDA